MNGRSRPQQPRNADDSTFDAAVAELRPYLVAQAQRRMPPQDVQDIVQDTIVRALRYRDRFKPGSNLRGWLVTMMTRLWLDKMKGARRRVEVATPDIESRAAPPVACAEQEWWANLTVEDVRKATSSMRPELRQVFEMFHFDRMRYDGIAQELGIRKSTVGTRLFRARRAIKSLLQTARMTGDT